MYEDNCGRLATLTDVKISSCARFLGVVGFIIASQFKKKKTKNVVVQWFPPLLSIWIGLLRFPVVKVWV